MEIVSIDGEIVEGWIPERSTSEYSVRNTLEVRRKTVLDLVPAGILLKARLPRHGFYVPHDVNIVVTPHISEHTGTRARLGIRDSRDLDISRYLYRSPEFNLGIGLKVTGSQLPFCLPMGDFPIQVELTMLGSAFNGKSRVCSISCQWSLTWSSGPFCRTQSSFKTDVIRRLNDPKVDYLLSKERDSDAEVNYLTGSSDRAVVRAEGGSSSMRSHGRSRGVSSRNHVTQHMTSHHN
jgi:hypothetical protein